MAQTIVIPQCSVSPAGGGTCAFVATTYGPIPFEEGYHFRGMYRNFRFTATPAAGYRFLHFDIEVEMTNSISGKSTHPSQEIDNPYETDYLNSGAYTWDGAAWWIEGYDEYAGYSEWISAITVTAVFELIPVDPKLLYDDGPNNTGRLIYDDGPNNTGRLIYGGV